MEEDKGKIKLIHIILFGVIVMLGIVFSVVFLNSSKNEYAVSIVEKDNSHIEEKNPNIEKENAKSIEEENKEYFQKEVEIIEEPIITNTGKSKNELTFKEAKIENNKLLIKLELATKSTPIKDLNNLFKVGLARLEIGPDIYSLNENYDEIFEISKLNDNLYEVYLIYDVRGLNVDRNINFIADIEIEEYEGIYFDNNSREIGKWNLKFSVLDDMIKDFDEKYRTENLIIKAGETAYSDEYCEVFGIRILEENIILNCLLSNYSTEPGIAYRLEFFDSDNNSLMVGEEVQVIGGAHQDILLKKFDLNSEINVEMNVYLEKDEKLGYTSTKLILSDYIKEINDNLDEKIEIGHSNGVEFSFDSNKLEVQKNNAFDVTNLKYLEYPIGLNRIGEKDGFYVWAHGFYINKYKNKFNQDLEELYDTREMLLELGLNETRREEYTIYEDIGPYDEWGIATDTKEYIFTHEEIMNIYNGGKIEKNGKEFDKEKFKEISKPYGEYKNFANVTIKGKEAITYIYYNGEAIRKYLIIIDDCIYEITVPLNLVAKEDFDNVLNSINFK